MKKPSRAMRIALLACVPLFAITACSSGGGRTGGESSQPAGNAGTKEITISMITHAAPGDTFWDIVRKGAETAARKDNVNLVYSSDPEGGRQAQLIKQAIDQKVDGIAVTFAKADAVQGAVADAIAAGIPVVGFNGGQQEALAAGAFTYIGQDDLVAGQAAGDRLVKDGYKRPICMIQEQGHVGLEARCAGMKEKIPATEILYVQGTDMTQVVSTLTAKLQSTPEVDIVVGLGAPYTLGAVGAVKDLGSDVKVASFDMSAELAKAVADGSVVFTVDQQPFLQGYESVDTLWLYNNGGFELGGGGAVPTGPTVIDAQNAGVVLEQAEQGIR